MLITEGKAAGKEDKTLQQLTLGQHVSRQLSREKLRALVESTEVVRRQ